MNYILNKLKSLSVLKIVLLLLGLFALGFGFGPIMFGYRNAGTIIISIYSIIVIATIFYGDKIKNKSYYKALYGGIILVTTTAILLTCIMLTAAYGANYKGEEPATVVVLGCKVTNGKPSLMLKYRLDRAYKELVKYPDAKCVVSGGHTDTEPMSEGEVMYNYLLDRGISKDRLFIENFSKNTEENISFSKRVIEQNNLPTTIIVATDGFHQFRAAFYSRLNGLKPYAATCKSPIGLTPAYYVREFAAIAKLIVLDIFF